MIDWCFTLPLAMRGSWPYKRFCVNSSDVASAKAEEAPRGRALGNASWLRRAIPVGLRTGTWRGQGRLWHCEEEKDERRQADVVATDSDEVGRRSRHRGVDRLRRLAGAARSCSG